MDLNEPEILYHYTDFAALDGILAHAQLRLNNVLNMNDASEMNLFMHSICKSITDAFNSEGCPDKARLTLRIFMREQSERFSYSSYAACFSRFRDDASQWERYGNQGKGVCIAFDGRLLSQMATGGLSIHPVIYQDSVPGHRLADELHDIIMETDIPDPAVLPPVLREALNRAWETSAVYKHPSFASENEVRLLISPFEHGFVDVLPEYHISKERIKKYYPVNLKEKCAAARAAMEDLITELVIGPESTQSLPILKDYLQSLGFFKLAEHISYSNCPLRRTNR